MILQASHFCYQHPFPIINACSKSYSKFLLDDFLTTLKVSVLSHDFQNWNPAMLPRLPQTNHFISYFIEKIWQSLPQIPTSRHTILLNACFYFALLSSAEAHVEGSYSLISPQKYFLIGFPIIFMHLAIPSQSGPFMWIFIYTCRYTYIDVGSVLGSGRSVGEGNGNPLQYSCLENFTDRGAWWVRVHGITTWQTWTEWLTPSYLSVQFSCSVVSHSWWPHELQHSRPPCPSQTPGVYSSSCPSSRWCHPAMSSSVVPFSSCPQSLPASVYFPTSQLSAWDGQNTGVSASASVLPVNTQDLSPSGWSGWISLQSKGLSRVFSNTTVQKHQFFSAQLSSQSNSHIHTWPLEKP